MHSRTHTIWISTALLWCVVHYSCKENPTQAPVALEPLIPLAIGNQWILQETVFDTLGKVRGIDSAQNETVLIIGDTTIEGDQWCFREYLGHLVAYRNSGQGTLIRLVSPSTDGVARLLFQNPLYLGNSYDYPLVFFSGSNAWLSQGIASVEVVAYGIPITVPAGTFQCAQFRVTRDSLSTEWQDIFVAPSYGWIRTDTYFQVKPGGGVYRIRVKETLSITTF